jgi:DNA-binding transcriptional LysR family regulator
MTYPNDILMDLSKKFNLDKIIYFIVLSDKKSFKKASDELYITQQALSFSIQSLEKELNVRLINRESKYDFLTEDGKIFLESAKQIIHNFNQMFKIKSNVPQNVETLDIYYTFIWSGDLILEIVEQIKMIHTELKINTILINTQMIFNKDFKFKKIILLFSQTKKLILIYLIAFKVKK